MAAHSPLQFHPCPGKRCLLPNHCGCVGGGVMCVCARARARGWRGWGRPHGSSFLATVGVAAWDSPGKEAGWLREWLRPGSTLYLSVPFICLQQVLPLHPWPLAPGDGALSSLGRGLGPAVATPPPTPGGSLVDELWGGCPGAERHGPRGAGRRPANRCARTPAPALPPPPGSLFCLG